MGSSSVFALLEGLGEPCERQSLNPSPLCSIALSTKLSVHRSCLSSAVATCPGATQPLQTESSGLKPLQTANGKVIVHERERRDFGPESLASRLSLWKEHCWHEEDRAGVVGPSRAT
ncbi:uncharacterized protein LOC134477434 isoform X2 [Cavia porcellus]|uniref:uncharacterized protein LOC134477434 isoform X2 n=1 Tax=Cavia porcellus TaxID=10141 RepID=UPI002FE1CF20